MPLSSSTAKLIAEEVHGITPFLGKGMRRNSGTPPKQYRFEFRGALTRHIAITTESKAAGVTVYVNQNSTNDLQFPKEALPDIEISETYEKGHEGKNGNPGIAGSVAAMPSLDPRKNAVLRLSVPTESAFRQLLNWYFELPDGLKFTSTIQRQFESTAVVAAASSSDSNQAILEVDEIEVKGTGYENDVKSRMAIERYAVVCAHNFYKQAGYSVSEKGKPYDLLCEKETENLHVEVKGSRHRLDAIIVTKNEVADARDPAWRSDLFLVEKINLDKDYKASGGNTRRLENWYPQNSDLTALQLRYKLPPISEAE